MKVSIHPTRQRLNSIFEFNRQRKTSIFLDCFKLFRAYGSKSFHELNFFFCGLCPQKKKFNSLSFSPLRDGLIYLALSSLALLFSSESISAQKLNKTFVQEIEVGSDVRILTNNPQQLGMEIHGTVMTKNSLDYIDGNKENPMEFASEVYKVTGKGGEEVLSIARDYEIKTWDKNVIKQEVEVTIFPEDQEEAQKLMNKLNISLSENGAKEVKVDANINIKKFELRNGLLKDNKSTIILNDGSRYVIKKMLLRSSLTIPKSNSLYAKTRYGKLKIGDMEGDVELDLYFCEVTAGKIKNLEAKMATCFNAYFEEVENGKVNATNSFIKIDRADNLHLGNEKLKPSMNFLSGLSSTSPNSSISKYHIGEVNSLNVTATYNDEFNIGTVGKLTSGSSVFSNYKIEKLTGSLYMNARSGDLSIKGVASLFRTIDINNQISTIILKMDPEGDFLINTYDNPTTEYFLPKDIKVLQKEEGWKTTYLKGDKSEAGVIDIRCEKCKVVF